MLVVIIFLLFALQWSESVGQDRCIQPSGYLSCACEIPDNGIINLEPLASDNGKPRFVNIIEHEGSGYYFSYNPCYGYTLGNKNSSCGGRLGRVAACQSYSDIENYDLGDSSTEKMYFDSKTGGIYLQYDSGQDGRITQVYLKCDPMAISPIITAEGDRNIALTYVFHLTTIYACPGK